MIYDLMTSSVTGFYVGIIFGGLGASVLWVLAILFHWFMKTGDIADLDLIHHSRIEDDPGRHVILEEGMTFVPLRDIELAPGFTWSADGFVPDEPD